MKKLLQVLCLVLGAWMVCSNGWAQVISPSTNITLVKGAQTTLTYQDVNVDGNSTASIIFSDSDSKNLITVEASGQWNSDPAKIIVTANSTRIGTAKFKVKFSNPSWNHGGYSCETELITVNILEGNSTGGGTDNPGTNPGTDTPPIVTPSTKTLAEKIAAREQLTNLATVYMTVPDAEGKNINDVLFKDRATNVADYHQTTIQVVENGCNDGTGRTLGNFTEAGLEIKVRGNSTAEMDKRPYRLRFYKDEKDAAGNVTVSHKHDMLGYGYEKRNWTILNNLRDGSYMQNAITYYIGKAVGMPFCPGYKFVDLVINNEYRGCYQLSDHVEVGSNRIDIDESTGWFVESTRNDMVEEPYFNSAGLYVLIKKPESKTEAGTAEIKQMIQQYFENNNNNIFGVYATGCDDKTFCDAQRGWRSVFDEESLVRFYVGLNLTGDSDGMMQVKMYREADGKMQFGPLWDKDLAFGVQDDGKTLAEGNSLEFGAPTFNNYIKKIMKTDPVFVKKVHDKLHEVIDNGYVENIIKEMDKIEKSLLQTKTLEYNNTGWRAVSIDNYPVAVERLRQYVRDHTKWFVDFMDERYESMGGDNIKIPTDDGTVDPGVVNPGTTEPAFEVEVPAGITFSSWDYKAIPASVFNKKATSATVSVKGAVFVCISNTNGESGAIVKFSWNDANKSGVTYELEGENLELAKKGLLYIGCNDDAGIKMTVTNHGVDVPEEPEGPTTAVRAQLTNIPTIYLDAAAINGEWQPATLDVYDKDGKLHASTWKAMTAEVKYQGSATEGSKNSYRLKFESKTQMLSNKYKQWVLASNDDDPSMINNALAKELGDAVGMPFTPGYQFVDLYINNVYMGTYQVTDRVKAEEGRALVEGGNKDVDWLVQFDDDGEIKENSNSTYITSTETIPNIVIKNPDPDDYVGNESALAQLKNEMTEYFHDTFFANISENVDKAQFINWYICQEILCSYKGISSIEAYRSVTPTASDNNVHFGPLWDSEKAFGNAPEHPVDMSDLNTNGSHNGLIIEYADYKKMRDILTELWKEEWFKDGVLEKWQTISSSNLLADLKSKATELSATLAQSQVKNVEVWSESLGGNASYAAAVKAVTDYLDARFAYLDVKFAEMASGKEVITLSSLVNAIEKMKTENVTVSDIEAIVNKLLEKE